jgi:thiol-disulfide isomerase/thioredoxin
MLGLALACHDGGGKPIPAYDAPLLSPQAVRRELSAACVASTESKRPLLLEFSAPWCSDCQKLHIMKQESVLASELARWPSVTINVGNFDAHRDLLEAFGVEQIAHWAVLAPNDCESAAPSWPRLAQRTLEPSSGQERSQSPSDLAHWLLAFRTR